MKFTLTKIFLLLISVFSIALTSCSKDDDPAPRSENDICGAWADDEGNCIYFKLPNICYKIVPEEEDWAEVYYDAYYYEPGYNFLLYIDSDTQPDIYMITALNDREMIWVWADNLLDEKYDGMSKSEILGAIIKQAQQGFNLDYDRTITFTRISMWEFEIFLEKYDCSYILGEI